MTVMDSLNTLIGVTDHLMSVRQQKMPGMQALTLAIGIKLTCTQMRLFGALHNKSDQDQATCVAIVTIDPEIMVCEVLPSCRQLSTDSRRGSGEGGRWQVAGAALSVENGIRKRSTSTFKTNLLPCYSATCSLQCSPTTRQP